jgi:hypothetical protein
MSSEDFAILVDEMARVRLKYEELQSELATGPAAAGGSPKRRDE